MTLRDDILAQIAAQGPMTLAQYMDLALQHPTQTATGVALT